MYSIVLHMQHVIRYRILGQHPAASGKYHSTGFSGESLPVRQFLEEVVKEHQINLSVFKTAVALVTTGAGGNDVSRGGGEAGNREGDRPSTTPSRALYPDDRLRNYDSVDITVSKRSFTDDAETAEEERRAQAKNRLRAAAAHFDLLASDVDAAPVLRGNLQDSRERQLPPHLQPQQGGKPSSVDALALQRAMALASKLFPVRPGQTSLAEGPDDEANDHVCALCELPSFGELFRDCCRFVVCKACLESGQAMMTKENECPVCGRQDNPSEAVTHHEHAVQRRRTLVKAQQQGDEKVGVAEAAVSGSRLKKRPAPRLAEEETKPALPPLQQRRQLGPKASHASSPSGSPPSRGPRIDDDGHSPLHSAAVLRVEQQLRESLDRTLSFLDAPDPLTAEMKAKRVKGAALTALDEAE